MYLSYNVLRNVLIDLSLTVKAATLIFIPRRGSAISSVKKRTEQNIYFIKLSGHTT